MYTLTTFRWVPPFVVGYVRDLRVRWALEEAGLPYQLRLIGPEDQPTPAYRQQQPFGQIPVLQDGAQTLFESGAILLHLGASSEALLPSDAGGRTHATEWAFAALNSVEPHVANLAELDAFAQGEAWAIERRPALEEMALKRLAALDTWLAGRDYLSGRFTVADILMTSVLRLLDDSGLVTRFPALSAYVARCTARPAFKKALADQVALYAPAQATA
ncbi:glutathione S-transferase family protein [Massilia terrae]|uniref:Glutathione S-transferase family protein n=1 Tax=Massilia terrae TaxID=1811224 RepID=A0ABT2D3K9_9BURK|nr:glutathione S-transferase family protein [Massilia terrae]MCS0660836.1 glutathione S-transferase family protein [Massilia terrae]